MVKALIAPALTSHRAAAFERIAMAAVAWVYDQQCATALADLEDSVCDFIGRDIDGTPRERARHGE